ncbi:hypothetical protein O181_067175 [Austropuccinia psidii MF-1]|uniref:Reverse transcriptase domain-containing protein n=1 Tax=Austropuccinia psidii MF-1 TaxID=1389203 RepID=A0A9Q3EQA6_9BASI|nr:hypothetical protein [Austropuccinia psidii MF-1]
MDLLPSSYHDSLERLWDEEEEPEELETVMKVVNSPYHHYLDLFSKVKAEKLPPQSACDHHIELEGSLPPNAEKGFIWPSSSSTGAPVLCVKKKDGGFRLCVDYRKLNAVTRKNKYPAPPMNQLLNVLNGFSIFSKVDLGGAYNLLRIKEGDEHLTVFRNKYGSCEYLVMPFGLTNAPASFQNLVNDIFQDLLDVYVVVYLDDIMVFPKSEEENVNHVSNVISRIRANNLFSKASKCLFHVYSVEYLGYVVYSEGLKMDQEKIQQILNWPPPRNLKGLQSFLGIANFYCCFIKNYSKKISSLTSFLKNYSCFPLNEETLSQFHQLKEAFTTTPILSHFNPSLPRIVETNAPDYSLVSVPSQENIPLHSTAASLYQLSSTMRFMTTTALDAISHWDNVYPERGKDFIRKNPMNSQQLIKQDEVQPSRYFAVKVESLSNLIESVHQKLWQYYQYRSILQKLVKGKSVQDYSIHSSSKLLLFKDWVVVPKDPTIQLSILQKHHDSPLAGHPGQEKTLKLVKQDIHWSGMNQFIKDYVSSCQQCSINKNIHHKKFGILKPLPIPKGPWICPSMDFITQLPLSKSFDSILVIVDQFSNTAVFIPTMSSITSPDLAHLFIKNIFSKHGLPSSIQLKISRDLSTAYHPETNGQTERVNQILEQYLPMYVSSNQDDWNTWLPLAQFSYNNSDHSSTKQSPFFTVYGRYPQFDSVHITKDNPAGKLSTKIQSVQKNFKRELEAAINCFGRSEIWLGPFQNLKKVSTHAYHLKLPSQWKSIHPVFHISLLEPVKTSTIQNGHQEPPPPIIIEEEEEWEVSQILDSKLKRGKLWYLVE